MCEKTHYPGAESLLCLNCLACPNSRAISGGREWKASSPSSAEGARKLLSLFAQPSAVAAVKPELGGAAVAAVSNCSTPLTQGTSCEDVKTKTKTEHGAATASHGAFAPAAVTDEDWLELVKRACAGDLSGGSRLSFFFRIFFFRVFAARGVTCAAEYVPVKYRMSPVEVRESDVSTDSDPEDYDDVDVKLVSSSVRQQRGAAMSRRGNLKRKVLALQPDAGASVVSDDDGVYGDDDSDSDSHGSGRGGAAAAPMAQRRRRRIQEDNPQALQRLR
jgi:hypothetical protein